MKPKIDLRQRRLERAARLLGWYKDELAVRLRESKRLLRRPCLAVDIHTHSICSDGLGTVAENCEQAKALGLDFMFATDHHTIRQKRMVVRRDDASWGQEPVAGPHHLGLLEGTRKFTPKRDSIAADVDRARAIAPFVWIPHPTGWYPDIRYVPDQMETLWTLGPKFAMEILNGANNLLRAWDESDARTVALWDRLLTDGREVTAIGASDAHAPEDIGTTFTGALARINSARTIVRALNAGRCFATEASLLDFTCNGRPMGSTVRVSPGAPLRFVVRAADAAGIASVRIVSQGKTVRTYAPAGQTLFETTWQRKATRGSAYFRLETTATDDRRAFSTPIYVRPEKGINHR